MEGRIVFQIYALIDPRNHLICYIGQSRNAVNRLRQHQLDTSVKVRQWMNDLDRSNLEPILKVIEEIEVVHSSTASARENYWIRIYHEKGAPLLNTQGVRTKYPNYPQKSEPIIYHPIKTSNIQKTKRENRENAV